MVDHLKTKVITISNNKSRDYGNSYLITEMPILEIDEWSIRAGNAMAKGGLDIKKLGLENGINLTSITGILDLVSLGIQGFGNIDPSTTKELLTELVDRCVKFQTKDGKTRPLDILYASDVKDLKTLNTLRLEAFKLHIDFFAIDES